MVVVVQVGTVLVMEIPEGQEDSVPEEAVEVAVILRVVMVATEDLVAVPEEVVAEGKEARILMVKRYQEPMVEMLVLLRSRAEPVQPELQAVRATSAVALVEQEVEARVLAVLCSCRPDIACWSIALLPAIRQQAGWEGIPARGSLAAFTIILPPSRC